MRGFAFAALPQVFVCVNDRLKTWFSELAPERGIQIAQALKIRMRIIPSRRPEARTKTLRTSEGIEW